ncbi:MAG: hypothetical protein AAB089_00690, partial [Nitrospirota bacterium]
VILVKNLSFSRHSPDASGFGIILEERFWTSQNDIKRKRLQTSCNVSELKQHKLFAVIPAPYQVRDKLQQESRRRPCENRELYKGIGFPFSRETLDSASPDRGRGQARAE